VSDEHKFRQQVTLLVIGALLSFVPTFITVTYQARQQRKQALLDRKLTALRDFTAALNSDGELFLKFDEVEAALISPPSPTHYYADFAASGDAAQIIATSHPTKVHPKKMFVSKIDGNCRFFLPTIAGRKYIATIAAPNKIIKTVHASELGSFTLKLHWAGFLFGRVNALRPFFTRA
jgi:hypothetical protein